MRTTFKTTKLAQFLVDAVFINTKAKFGAFVDFDLDPREHRFYLVDIPKKEIVYSWYTSHGTNTGSRLKATSFSNENGSLKSCLGRFKCGETYFSSKFGYALRIDGLDKNQNDHARKRSIVVHPADYVGAEYILKNRYPGRSNGCFTLNPKDSRWIIDSLKDGSPLVSYYSDNPFKLIDVDSNALSGLTDGLHSVNISLADGD